MILFVVGHGCDGPVRNLEIQPKSRDNCFKHVSNIDDVWTLGAHELYRIFIERYTISLLRHITVKKEL